MAPLHLRRIDYGSPNAPAQLTELRSSLGASGNVVSARGRELTLKVFGEPLPPVRVVSRICEDVCAKGLDAVLHYTEQFDGVRLNADTLRVTRSEMAARPRRGGPAPAGGRPPNPAERAVVSVSVCCTATR